MTKSSSASFSAASWIVSCRKGHQGSLKLAAAVLLLLLRRRRRLPWLYKKEDDAAHLLKLAAFLDSHDRGPEIGGLHVVLARVRSVLPVVLLREAGFVRVLLTRLHYVLEVRFEFPRLLRKSLAAA
jgi:hypothetical protein